MTTIETIENLPAEMIARALEYCSALDVLAFSSASRYCHSAAHSVRGVEYNSKKKPLAAFISAWRSAFRIVLDLSHTGVVDVSDLGGVHVLDLWHTGVVDVSALGGVRKLIR